MRQLTILFTPAGRMIVSMRRHRITPDQVAAAVCEGLASTEGIDAVAAALAHGRRPRSWQVSFADLQDEPGGLLLEVKTGWHRERFAVLVARAE